MGETRYALPGGGPRRHRLTGSLATLALLAVVEHRGRLAGWQRHTVCWLARVQDYRHPGDLNPSILLAAVV